MPRFRYKARDKEGILLTGEIDATSAEELKEGIFHEGMTPIEVREIRRGGGYLQAIHDLRGRVRSEDLISFTRQFHTLFKAGVNVDTILGALARQTGSAALRNALIRIRTDVTAGATLAQAFGRHQKIFDELYVSMLSAGEEAGILEDVLKNLCILLEKDFEIRKNVKGATLYPKIVVTALVLAIGFLVTFVIPQFAKFYEHYGAALPLPTRILMGTSHFCRHYWFVVLAFVVLAYLGYGRLYRTAAWRLKIDRFKFRMPVLGALSLKIANARFGHILSALYRSGLTMPRSLDIVSNVVGNMAFATEVRKVRDELQGGASLSDALLHQTYFPPVIVEATAVGEQTGSLSEILSAVAEHFDLEVSHTVKNLTTLLEPLLLVCVFGMVALLALAVYLPIWNLSSAVLKR